MSALSADLVERARETRIEAVIEERGIKLRGRIDRCGACPLCGGIDRFSIHVKKQVFNCRVCGSKGDVIDLVRLIEGCSFPEAVERLIGSPIDGRQRPPIDDAARRRRDAERAAHEASEHEEEAKRLKIALDLFEQADDPHGTDTERYLAARRLELPFGADAIRHHSRCIFGDERVPCMIALFRDNFSNEPVGVQRTLLPPGGWVRGMKMRRKNLGPTGSGSIKIDEDADVLYGLTIGEGLETVLAGRMFGHRPTWATGGKGTLKRFPVLPEPVQSLSVHWEPDAAEDVRQCLDRWSAAGRETIILKSLFGKDVADSLWEGP